LRKQKLKRYCVSNDPETGKDCELTPLDVGFLIAFHIYQGARIGPKP
jgi:hypothetical protein